ncbi:MAG: hypothetical protein VW270_19145 [Candidatus Poseidoniales archaeon]
MGRGAMKKLNWFAVNESIDIVMSNLEVDEIWIEDLIPKVIDLYEAISGHRVIIKNSYPLRRFSQTLTTPALLKRGWECKHRMRTQFIGEPKRMKRGKKRKAFRIVKKNE